ncbi:MAG: hypothetical protein GXO74_06160 [Calditrichaeota bacterium]|nr:hypothetical protein [Calditrichota bacterium]
MRRLLTYFLFVGLFLASNIYATDTGYKERVAEVLRWAENSQAQNFLIAAAKILDEQHHQEGVDLFEKIMQRKDNSQRGMFIIYEMMTGYLAAENKMPDDLKQKVRDYLAVADFYRGDTENHLTMYHTGLYLAAQTFPDLPAEKWFNGKSSAENMKDALGWLNYWMKTTTTIGQGEFDSPTYMTVFISPMFSLYTFAKDPVIKQNALGILHWLIADYAVEHLNGIYCGAHSRDYPERAIRPKCPESAMTAWGWLFFGKTDKMIHPTLLTAAFSDFDLPEVLYAVGTEREKPYVETETKRVRNIIRFSDQKNPPVYKYTYMTKEFALGSMMGGGILQPIQQHTWDISFNADSPYQSIFTVHPYIGEKELGMFFPEEMKFALDEVARAHTYYGKEDKWASSSPYEETFQHKNALIVLYNIPEGTKFGHIDGFFPKDLAKRESDESGWIFCQAGNTYIAYFPLKPYQWIEEDNCFRLRSYDLKNGCIVEAAMADEYPSFAAFKKQIRSNNLVHDTFDQTLTVSYTTSAGDVMTFTYDGPRLLNGKPINFADYKMFKGPFLNSEMGSQKLEILDKIRGKGIMVDFASDEKALLLPVYMCKKIDKDFELTGKMDNPAWQKAEPVELPDAITGEPGRFKTEVRVLYSDRYLYVGFYCEDDYVWGTVKKRDGEIYNEECVEVFLNPADCGHQYYEINLSPLNVVYDACVINSRTPENPEGEFMPLPQFDIEGLKTATHIIGEKNKRGGAKGWIAEYAIPFDKIYGAPNVPPKAGDSWRVNFYRIDSPKKDQREHYAWSKTERAAFHLPWKFGILKFGK